MSATESRKKKATEMAIERALAEDPSTFQYDEVYEEIQEKKNEKLEDQKKADKERKVSSQEAHLCIPHKFISFLAEIYSEHFESSR